MLFSKPGYYAGCSTLPASGPDAVRAAQTCARRTGNDEPPFAMWTYCAADRGRLRERPS